MRTFGKKFWIQEMSEILEKFLKLAFTFNKRVPLISVRGPSAQKLKKTLVSYLPLGGIYL